MNEPTETVDLVGVRANGEHVNLGKVTMPPRMKAREIAQSYFGPFQDDDGSEAESCFGALDELIGWLAKQGWTPPQPTQAQAGAELAEADRRAGAAERELASCREDVARFTRVRDQMKEQWGVDRNVSFDVVWAEALRLKQQAGAVPIDSNDRRKVFQAGFERGWDAARKQGEKP